MAVHKTLPQICILLTTLCSFVSSQQATAPGDTNSLFSNLLATTNPQGQSQPQIDPNTPSFGTMGGSPGFGGSMGGNLGFLGGQAGGMQGRGLPAGFPMSQMGGMGGMGSNPPPAPAPRPNVSQSLMPMMMLSGSDVMQRAALMSMLGGGAGGMGGGGGMMSNPFLALSLMNM